MAPSHADPQALKQYKKLLDQLAQLAQAFGFAQDLFTIYRTLRDFAAVLVPYNGLFIALYDADEEMRTCVYAAGDGDEYDVAQLPPMPLTGNPQSRAITTQEVIITDDLQPLLAKGPRVDVGMDKDPRLPQSSIVAPMLVMGRVIGTIEVQSVLPAAYGMEQAGTLSMVANLAAMAIENVRLLQQERELRLKAEASELRFRELFENANDILFTVDTAGHFTSINRLGESLWGYGRAEIAGLNIRQLIAPEYVAPVEALILAPASGERTAPLEIEMMTKEGVRMPFEVNTRPICRDGELVGRQAIARDITERKRVERALRESETKYRTLFEDSRDAIYITTRDGRFIDINQAGLDLLGCTRQKIMSLNARDFYVDPEDRQKFQQKVVEKGFVRNHAVRLRRYNGEVIDCLLATSVQRAPDGTVIGYRGIIHDITELKRAEEALRESEELYRSLVQTSPDAITLTDLEGNILICNQQALTLHGWNRMEEVIGHSAYDFIAPEDVSRANANIRRTLQEGSIRNIQYNLLKKDGSRFPAEFSASLVTDKDGKPRAFIGLARDITERLRVEAAEREQRVLAEALADSAASLNRTLNLDEVLDRILINVERVVPHDGANVMFIESGVAYVVRKRGYEIAPGSAEAVDKVRFTVAETANLRSMFETGRPYIISDIGGYPDWVPLEATNWISSYVSAPICLEEKVIGFLNLDSATANAFTAVHAERLQAFADQAAIALQNASLYREMETYNESLAQAVAERTEELQRTKEQVEIILDSSPDAILLLGADGKLVMGNRAIGELFGYGFEEVLRRGPLCLVAPKYATTFMDALVTVMQLGQKKRLEIVAQRKDGTTLDVDVALAPVWEGKTAPAVICSLRDITALKEVERIKDAFVSNVSHELRTPITSLSLSHSLISANPQKREIYLARMKREIDRLRRIIEDLLRLSLLDQAQTPLSLAPVDINKLAVQYVGDRLPLANSAGLQLHIKQEPSLSPVMADEGLLGQALSILLTNAINYTPAGGKITVYTGQQRIDGRYWVGFSVHDTGPGIPMAEQGQLFERFYRGTAGRESGTAGTGLGLSIAREIIHRHQGQIELFSSGVPGQGTLFTVRLPAEVEEPNGMQMPNL